MFLSNPYFWSKSGHHSQSTPDVFTYIYTYLYVTDVRQYVDLWGLYLHYAARACILAGWILFNRGICEQNFGYYLVVQASYC